MRQISTITLTDETRIEIEEYQKELGLKYDRRVSFTDAFLERFECFSEKDYDKIKEIEVPKGRINKPLYFRNEKDPGRIQSAAKDLKMSEFIEKCWRFYNEM